MSNIQTLYVDNDTLLEVTRLRNDVTGDFLNSATVMVTLNNSAGVAVVGDTWPKPMSYVPASEGTYRATMPYTLALTSGQRYTAELTADAGAGLHATWQIECVARNRTRD